MASPIHLEHGTAERMVAVDGFDVPGYALVLDGFVRPSVAALLVALHRNNRHICPNHPPGCEHFDGRILYPALLPASYDRAAAYEAAASISRAIEARLSGGRRVHDDGPQIALWPPGFGMPVHEDKQVGVEHRAFGGLLYLNDDFQGGETVFPTVPVPGEPGRFGVKLRPAAGRLVIYTGLVPHGTCDVLAGERYTMPSFHQYDAPTNP